jgi:antitoxin component YwqK of YwqJK toxin-antitoxin module
MEKVINTKVKIIKLEVDYYQLVEILKYTECGNQLEVKTNNKMIRWYSNGQIECRTNYIDGKLNGLSEEWYYNGHMSKSMNYVNDRLNGLSEKWYDNGKLKEMREYKSGTPDGIWIIWDYYGLLWTIYVE